MITIFTTVFLGICAATDLYKKQIWWPLSVFFIAVVMALHFVRGDRNLWDFLAGIFLGGGLLFVSWATREAIGYGDGLTVAACGAALGFVGVLQLLLLALMFAAVWSGILLISRKGKKKDSFPFIPFLLAAQLCVLTV